MSNQRPGGKYNNEHQAAAVIGERRKHVLRLLKLGLSRNEIAEHLHVSPATVANDRRIVLEELGQERRDIGEGFVDITKARLDDLLKKLMLAIVPIKDGEGRKEPDFAKVVLPTVDRLLKLIEQQRKLLGLDAAQKVAIEFSAVDEIARNIATIALRFIPEAQHEAFAAALDEALTGITRDAAVTKIAIEAAEADERRGSDDGSDSPA